MFITLLILFFVLLITAMIIYARRPHVVVNDPFYNDFDDEVVTTTTTTTTVTEPDPEPAVVADAQPEYVIEGELKRKKARNGQLYVVDPQDKDKVFVNAFDDLYEDGAGKIWKLV
jgi:hypothetical protein